MIPAHADIAPPSVNSHPPHSGAKRHAPSCEQAIAIVAQIALQMKDLPGALLPILHAVQEALGYIPPETVKVLAETLNRSRAEIHGVLTFYPHFRTAPKPPHLLQICRAEACQAMGGEALAAHAQARLACEFHASSPDGSYALEPVYCLGLCAQAPALMLDDQPHARVTPAKLDRIIAQHQDVQA